MENLDVLYFNYNPLARDSLRNVSRLTNLYILLINTITNILVEPESGDFCFRNPIFAFNAYISIEIVVLQTKPRG